MSYKKTIHDLYSQLNKARKQKAISRVYKFPKSKHKDESEHKYLSRIVNNSHKYKFVNVSGKIKNQIVAFGTPGPIITKFGKFQMVPAKVIDGKWGLQYILIYPNLTHLLRKRKILLRISSGCYSGMVLGDTTCDCRRQYELSLKKIIQMKGGVLILIPNHDGRGWPKFKMAIQQLMNELKIDTISAAKLFFRDTKNIDIRTFDESAIILKALGFNSKNHFRLLSESKNKISSLSKHKLNILGTESLKIHGLTKEARDNSRAKKAFYISQK